MLLVVLLLTISGSALLIIAGYFLGANRAAKSRRQLVEESLELAKELRKTRSQLTEEQRANADVMRANLDTMLNTLVRHTDTMQKLVEPLTRPRDGLVEGLQKVIQQALAPITQRDRLALELFNLPTDGRDRMSLTRLLDEIADKGQFWAVLLSDRDGLPLAASSNCWDLNRLTVISSLTLLLAERIGRDGAPAPLSVQIHDEADMATVCRIFKVNGQQLLLTAVTSGASMNAAILDPALKKVASCLSKPWSSNAEAMKAALSAVSVSTRCIISDAMLMPPASKGGRSAHEPS